MAKKQQFVRQPSQDYYVYNEKALEIGQMHETGISSYKVSEDGKVSMTESEARYYLSMGIVGTMPKDEWNNHFALQSGENGQGADAGKQKSRAPIDSRNDTHNARPTGLSQTHDVT